MLEKGRNKPNPSKGEKNGSAKLKTVEVLEMRKEYEMGNISKKEIAEKYDLTLAHVSSIVNYKAWRHLPPANC
jgi:hypothetical protein